MGCCFLCKNESSVSVTSSHFPLPEKPSGVIFELRFLRPVTLFNLLLFFVGISLLILSERPPTKCHNLHSLRSISLIHFFYTMDFQIPPYECHIILKSQFNRLFFYHLLLFFTHIISMALFFTCRIFPRLFFPDSKKLPCSGLFVSPARRKLPGTFRCLPGPPKAQNATAHLGT